ncbi:phosphatidate cytidylyltransferase [Galbitalea soli]|uniref:Phosphatidate cytidylyltransferase n=1 Tax=Galbitalea soli TaxID=1268042 RepID=A0A7C9TQN5_9MICO|nr:phosphatidate cytidylyltransferase [Galbitalea soli]NEM91576.1 phosphatidate cytidylyltransferase [Galbitalea soli]NYJ30270.1 phosphatidate cytidylyltransferase [Galbitalea soli]
MSDAPEGLPPHKSKRAHSRAEFEATVADIEAQVRATNARIEARTGRNLVAAIAIGLVFGALFLVSLIVIKEIFMAFAAVLLGALALELSTALRVAGRMIPRVASAVAAVAIVPAAFYFHTKGQWIAALLGMLFVTLWRLVELARPTHRVAPRELLRDILGGVFVQGYVVFLGSFAVVLTGQPGGQWWTLALLIVVIGTDTGAYASGLLFGKHKMAPRISPKKTWEGFAGSILVASLAGVLVGILMVQQPWWIGLAFGLTIAFTATLGDLTESLIKRDLGIKDISTWLPGHGGFLDRLDSTLPSAAVAFAFYLLTR